MRGAAAGVARASAMHATHECASPTQSPACSRPAHPPPNPKEKQAARRGERGRGGAVRPAVCLPGLHGQHARQARREAGVRRRARRSRVAGGQRRERIHQRAEVTQLQVAHLALYAREGLGCSHRGRPRCPAWLTTARAAPAGARRLVCKRGGCRAAAGGRLQARTSARRRRAFGGARALGAGLAGSRRSRPPLSSPCAPISDRAPQRCRQGSRCKVCRAGRF